MKLFLIQCDKEGIPVIDMAYQIIEGVRFHRWLRHYVTDWEFDYILIKDKTFIDNKTGSKYTEMKNCIPIGTIEFVEKFLYESGLKLPKPINIPKELQLPEFLKREIKYVKISDIEQGIVFDDLKFVKSEDMLKGASGLTPVISEDFLSCERPQIDSNEKSSKFIVSDILNIESEWRCFVHRNQLVDVCKYSGDFDKIPDKEIIEKMITCYSNCPPAYTLDVAVLESGETVIIEVHNFWSCGLYGLEGDEKMLHMAVDAFQWEVKRLKKGS